MNTDFQMPRRSDRCFASGKVFEVGDPIAVVLLETTEGYERRDYAGEAAPETLQLEIARWRTTKRAPAQSSPHAIDRAAIFEFFKRLNTPESPEQVQFRFVLSLLLWRKKVINFERSEPRNEGEIWYFMTPKSNETFEVFRPELDDEDIERLSTQLETLLSDDAGALQAVGDAVEANA